MKVLVTGGTGFVGYHSVRALLERGHEVRVLARTPAKAERVLAGLPVELAPGDMSEREPVRAALRGCEGALHCAAMVSFDRKQALRVARANELGVQTVIGEALALGLEPLVHVSSVAALFDPSRPVITADSPVSPGQSLYQRSKAAGDLWVRAQQERGAPVQISYPVAVVGPEDPGLSEANMAVSILMRLVHVDAPSAFQMVDVRDLAAGHAALFDGPVGARRHLFGGHCMPWAQLHRHLCEVAGRRVPSIPLPGWLLRGLGRGLDQVRRVVPVAYPLTAEGSSYMTRWVEARSSASVAELGVEFRSPQDTLADTLRWLWRAGHLPARAVGQLAA